MPEGHKTIRSGGYRNIACSGCHSRFRCSRCFLGSSHLRQQASHTFEQGLTQRVNDISLALKPVVIGQQALHKLLARPLVLRPAPGLLGGREERNGVTSLRRGDTMRGRWRNCASTIVRGYLLLHTQVVGSEPVEIGQRRRGVSRLVVSV